jgi:branched-chain amino acid transport system permease protein
MRNQSRISSLITAIGVSMLLQSGGQLFLPNSPPPNIREEVNSYRGNITVYLQPPAPEFKQSLDELKPKLAVAEAAWTETQKSMTTSSVPTPEQKTVQENYFKVRDEVQVIQGKADGSAVTLSISRGYILILGLTIFLMLILTYLVKNTKAGRAMRAVSHDFDSAALMGVNVNQIIVFTFVLGSSLAGAGAMMKATFINGTKIDTFFGLLDGVKAFVAAVLGGIGNIPGAVIGGVVLGLAEAIVVWSGGSDYKDAVAFIILVLVLLFKPGGIFGSNKVEKV